VLGCQSAGINFRVFIGKNIRGKVRLRSAPTSERLKKPSSVLATSSEAPILPLPDISSVSAPLNILRINREPKPATPIF